jgi:hypothetical protein
LIHPRIVEKTGVPVQKKLYPWPLLLLVDRKELVRRSVQAFPGICKAKSSSGRLLFTGFYDRVETFYMNTAPNVSTTKLQSYL